MKLKPNQLNAQLSKGLAPIYLLHGDEPLLLQESLDTIIAAAKKHDFPAPTNRYATAQFDWQSLVDDLNNIDLFAAKNFIKLSLPTGKPGTSGGKIIQEYLKQPSVDNILVIVCDKLESSTYKTAWYKAIEQNGVIVQVFSLQGRELSAWLEQRLAQQKLAITDEALKKLTYQVTGNLLAAQQEIDKLGLLYAPDTTLTLEHISNNTTDQAHFELFDLTDAWLANNTPLYCRILTNLREQNIAPTLILWALARECRQLASLAFAIEHGESRHSAIQKLPSFRQAAAQQHLQRHALSDYHYWLQLAAAIDRMIKGASSGDAWDKLSELAFTEAFQEQFML